MYIKKEFTFKGKKVLGFIPIYAIKHFIKNSPFHSLALCDFAIEINTKKVIKSRTF